MAAIARIRAFEQRYGAHCIGGGGVICVVGRHNILLLNEIYSFFKSEKLSVKFNPLFVSGRASGANSVLPEEFAAAMCDLFDTWLEDRDDTIRVDTFEDVMKSLISGKPRSCASNQGCTKSYVSVGPLGDIYPCGRFDGLRSFHLGNVNDGPGLRAALSSRLHQWLDSRQEQIDSACRECDIYTLCNGGCMHNALTAGEVMGKDPFCDAYRMLFGHVRAKLQVELQAAQDSLQVSEKESVS